MDRLSHNVRLKGGIESVSILTKTKLPIWVKLIIQTKNINKLHADLNGKVYMYVIETFSY